MSNEQINHWYDLARANGAIGGKLIGAGGGGFLMFLATDGPACRKVMHEEGIAGGPVPVRLRGDESCHPVIAPCCRP